MDGPVRKSGDMDVITHTLGNLADLKPGSKLVDRVRLSSEERASAHRVCVSEQGRRIPLSLPRGVELQDGDILAYDGDTVVVAVAAPEALYVIRGGSDPVAWAVIGYQLGNLHRPVRFLEDALLTPQDPMVADVLSRLGASFKCEERPFVGKRLGAVTDHHHHDA